MEIIIVSGIVIIAAVYIGRSLYRTMTGKKSKCGCSAGCQSCSINEISKENR